MNIDIVNALIAILGIILGAILQYLFTKWMEMYKHRQYLQSQAYVDFLKSVSYIAVSQKYDDTQKEIEAIMSLTDAKSRVCIYGSKSVVKKMSYFFKVYGILNSPEAKNAYTDVAKCMRHETVSKNEFVETEDLMHLLF